MQTWKEIYEAPDIDKKAALFQSMIYDSYCKIFHEKEIRVREDDKPWFTEKLKHLNQKKKREAQFKINWDFDSCPGQFDPLCL